ncbi:hypothetical protein EJV44_19020 [Ancylobacter aquaticus]|nr:hypothetical protein EJV44_19020 [Ancylobacter aquaticus]
MSELILVTIAVPAAIIADARQLSRCIGYSADDEDTFREPSWQDGSGNLYAVASGWVKPAFAEDAIAPLVEPEWGADMEAAGRAQATLRVSDMCPPEDPEAPAPSAEPADTAHICAVIGLEGLTALGLLGLTPVPQALE